MAENGNNGYYDYEVAVGILKDKLDIRRIYMGSDSSMAPTLAKWIAEKLVVSGLDDTLELVKLVQEEYKKGKLIILAKDCDPLYRDVIGLDPIEEDDSEEDIVETPEYDEEVFAHLWTEFMASLWTQLEMLYWPYLHPSTPTGCGCACGNGENYSNWENYTSGVTPEDDEYKTDFGYASETPSYGSGCCSGYRRL